MLNHTIEGKSCLLVPLIEGESCSPVQGESCVTHQLSSTSYTTYYRSVDYITYQPSVFSYLCDFTEMQVQGVLSPRILATL